MRVAIVVATIATSMSSEAPACSDPSWHTVYTLAPEDGCPGEWLPSLVPGLGAEAGLNVTVCGRRVALGEQSDVERAHDGRVHGACGKRVSEQRDVGSVSGFRVVQG